MGLVDYSEVVDDGASTRRADLFFFAKTFLNLNFNFNLRSSTKFVELQVEVRSTS